MDKVAQGTLSSIKALGTATGALLGAPAMERFGPVAVYRGAGAIVFAQTVLFAATTRCFRPRPEAPRYARLEGPSAAAQGTMPVE
jgi:predicted MFS family arabinose efflux permease